MIHFISSKFTPHFASLSGLFLLLSVLLLGAACSDDTVEEAAVQAEDTTSAADTSADTTLVEDTLEEDTTLPPPLRQMTTRALFGGLPIDNRFLDPNFASLSGQSWLAFGGGFGGNSPTFYKTYTHNNPMGMPSLFMAGEENPSGGNILGMAKSTAAESLQASIWVGSSVTEEPATFNISVLGTFEGGDDASVSLRRDDQVPTQTIDGILWRRYAVFMERGPVGWIYLMVSITSPSDFYISAPILAPVSSLKNKNASQTLPPIAIPQALSSHEREMVRRAREFQRNIPSPSHLSLPAAERGRLTTPRSPKKAARRFPSRMSTVAPH